MKIFAIRDHKRCGVDHQTKNATAFGADRIWTLGQKRRQNHIDDVVVAVTDGDEFGITHLWLLAETNGKTKARDQMCDAVERLLAKGCSITETSTGRTCTGAAELAAMIKDASNAIASRNRTPNRTPGPVKRVYTLDEAQAIADVWLRKGMVNDAERLAELKRRGFQNVTVTAWYREIKPMLAKSDKSK